MKLFYVLGFSGLALGAVVAGYSLQASGPALAETSQDAQETTVEADKTAGASASQAEAGPAITVYKSPSCSCCADWGEHLETHGFGVEMKSVDNLQAVKIESNVPREMASCHTAVIDGLVVEGHVPAEDITAYLEYRKANFGDRTIGLSVPGMPHGTPGMETGRKDSFEVLAFTADGEQKVVNRYDEY